MVFTHPHRIEPEFFGVSDLIKQKPVVLGWRTVLGVIIEEREQAEFHELYSSFVTVLSPVDRIVSFVKENLRRNPLDPHLTGRHSWRAVGYWEARLWKSSRGRNWQHCSRKNMLR